MLGIYALSKALGVQYLHMQPECVGHIGGLPHYQGQDCSSRMTAADYKALNRVQKVLALPSPQGLSIEALNSSSSGGSGGWFVERLDDVVLTWDALRKAVHSALQQQRSTVIKLARVQALLCHHPDVFLAVPQLRPPVSKQKVGAQGGCVLGGGELTHCTTEGQPPDGSYAVANRLVGKQKEGAQEGTCSKTQQRGDIWCGLRGSSGGPRWTEKQN
jgi:hypothetical protein